jgi:S-adenosylmethionine decarboxylase proenzyme
MQGLHLTADLQGCPAQNPLMVMVTALEQHCLAIVAEAGLQAVGQCFHAFPSATPPTAGGITGMVLLAESHLAIHTWPESGIVTLDVFVCNKDQDNSRAARQLLEQLVTDFKPERCQVQEVLRIAHF